MEVLDLILKNNVERMSQQTQSTENRRKFNKSSKRGRSNQNEIETCFAPCLDDQEVDMACEVLKVLFNLTVSVEKYNMEEVSIFKNFLSFIALSEQFEILFAAESTIQNCYLNCYQI